VAVDVGVSNAPPGVPATGTGWLLEQLGGGRPGSEVTRQQEIKPLMKIHTKTARISPPPIKIHWKMEGWAKVVGWCA
jgi:hypothetical protein